MREVQVADAESCLGELLRDVEDGESIAITRHGKTIAHIVPPDSESNEGNSAAVDRFLERRATWRRVNMSLEEILEARHEGHRF